MEHLVSLDLDVDLRAAVMEPPTGGWHLVHDFCFALGGAERVTSVLASRVLPDAPVHCLGGDDELLARMVPDRPTTRLFPAGLAGTRSYRYLAPFMVAALAARAPLRGNLLASSYALAHHVPVEGRLVVYCHSPLRQLWSGSSHHRPSPAPVRWALRATAPGLRRLDRNVAARAGQYVATSVHVRKRILAAYGPRDVPVVPPPVEGSIHGSRTGPEREDWLLYAGRLVEPYKQVGLLIEAVRGTDLRLVVAGDGRDRPRLEADAPPNVTFVGSLSTPELVNHYERARALVMPSEEDFGMVSTEAQTCGTPVVARRTGGGGETVVDGLTGAVFDGSDPRHLARLLRRVVRTEWNHDAIALRAETLWSEDAFTRSLRAVLELDAPGPVTRQTPRSPVLGGLRR